MVKSKTPDNLVQDIYGVFEDPQVSDEQFDELGKELSSVFKDALKIREGPPTLRMSSIGQPCVRKLWYEINAPEKAEPLTGKERFKFLIGHLIESTVLFLAKAAGHRVEGQQDEQNIAGVLGHRDAVIDGRLFDVKSASPYSFDKFKNGKLRDDDAFGYIDQIQSYLSAGQDDPIVEEKDKASFLVVQKVTGDICVDTHEKEDINFEEVYEYKKKIVSDPEPPARGFSPVPEGKSGNEKLSVNCSYCVAPTTKILKANLTWIDAANVKVGDDIVGFDKEDFKHYRFTKVSATTSIRLPSYRIKTNRGEIVVSSDHLFVAGSLTGNYQWRRADSLYGGCRIKFFNEPWETPETYEIGYLRGFLDGEGHWSTHKLSWAQNPGPVIEYVNSQMAALGFPHIDRYVKPHSACKMYRIAGSGINSYHALGMIRPLRLLEKGIQDLNGRRTWSKSSKPAVVLSVEFIGEIDLISITTENETLITNGFFSHNCPFKQTCYPDARLFLYSTGPVWLTTVVKEPRVPEVIDGVVVTKDEKDISG